MQLPNPLCIFGRQRTLSRQLVVNLDLTHLVNELKTIPMDRNSIPRLVVICVSTFVTATSFGQTFGSYEFQAKDLAISGGESSPTNLAACTYIGKLSIGTNGVITGTITRREFPADSSTSKPNSVTIDPAKSKVAGGQAYHGQTRTVITNAGSIITTTETTYGSDFSIVATNKSLTNFLIKGRALHTIGQIITKSTAPPPIASPATNNYRIVDLDGVSFSSGQVRGIFNAN
jgi:hypothetical protein